MAEGSNPFEPVATPSLFCGGIFIGFNILEHTIVPGHRVLDDDEVETILSKYGIEKEKLSKIRMTDPAIDEIGANPGDIIEITRTSETAGESVFYRLAIE